MHRCATRAPVRSLARSCRHTTSIHIFAHTYMKRAYIYEKQQQQKETVCDIFAHFVVCVCWSTLSLSKPSDRSQRSASSDDKPDVDLLSLSSPPPFVVVKADQTKADAFSLYLCMAGYMAADGSVACTVQRM